MDEAVYVAQSVSLAALTEALQDPRLRWAYAERLENIVLTWHDALLNDATPLERWLHGRAFSQELEVCWWQRDDDYEVRATVSAGKPPSGITWTPLNTGSWQAADDQVALLVGDHDADRPGNVPTWSAARIPRYLPYPVPVSGTSPARVALVARAYQSGGIVVTQRLLRVEGV